MNVGRNCEHKRSKKAIVHTRILRGMVHLMNKFFHYRVYLFDSTKRDFLFSFVFQFIRTASEVAFQKLDILHLFFQFQS